VKMITGDHAATAKAVGRKLGIARAERALLGSDLTRLDGKGLDVAASDTAVFARVAPEHKLRLVESLQRQGHVVAMTGDGVNDAPALKQSNIGVAMGITGTSVSKEAADMVLMDDNFATIVAAVEEGRRVYDNLLKSLVFVLPTNLALALIMMVAVLAFPFNAQTQLLLLPISATQLLWINLVATVTLALPLAFEAKEPDVMQRPPRKQDEPIINRTVMVRTLLAAVVMTTSVVGLFQWTFASYMDRAAPPHGALAEAQTMAVTTAIAFQVFYLFHCRSLRSSLTSVGFFSNGWVFAGVLGITLLQAAFIFFPPLQRVFGTTPLSMQELATSVAVGLIGLPLISLEKWLTRRLALSS
jgi:magnesium-transporting ATPase (P-type)